MDKLTHKCLQLPVCRSEDTVCICRLGFTHRAIYEVLPLSRIVVCERNYYASRSVHVLEIDEVLWNCASNFIIYELMVISLLSRQASHITDLYG